MLSRVSAVRLLSSCFVKASSGHQIPFTGAFGYRDVAEALRYRFDPAPHFDCFPPSLASGLYTCAFALHFLIYRFGLLAFPASAQ
jgi:hypothetical protein